MIELPWCKHLHLVTKWSLCTAKPEGPHCLLPFLLGDIFIWCLGEALATVGKGEAPRALPDHLRIWLSLVALKGSERFWKVPLTLETFLSVPRGTRHDGTPSLGGRGCYQGA